ncbi:MAG TPA: hypothetical protein PKC39_08110 [Ferruginibacter sp.]|nr:hypothetical protein [Ferruginibacter sp.]HMP20908.1 hypothetical protein [Ferruginibacter sp.]
MKLSVLAIVLFLYKFSFSQAVGVGTLNPQKTLSVNGSLLIDQDNKNFGTLDSAGLSFGTIGRVGISSNKAVTGNNLYGLDFWVGGTKRMVITSGGNVGINTSNPQFGLDVNTPTYLYSLSTIGVDASGSVAAGYDLRASRDLVIGRNASITGNTTLGGTPDASYKLKVIGNGLFTTNIGVDGTLRVNGKITNEGKAIMLSNSSTTLRSGFSLGTFTLTINPGQFYDITFPVTPFVGTNSNVRVMIAQFAPGTGATNWGSVTMVAHSPLASDPTGSNGSTVKVRFTNTSASVANLGSNATLYLFSVVTH